jgi:hypothetical protein
MQPLLLKAVLVGMMHAGSLWGNQWPCPPGAAAVVVGCGGVGYCPASVENQQLAADNCFHMQQHLLLLQPLVQCNLQ